MNVHACIVIQLHILTSIPRALYDLLYSELFSMEVVYIYTYIILYLYEIFVKVYFTLVLLNLMIIDNYRVLFNVGALLGWLSVTLWCGE